MSRYLAYKANGGHYSSSLTFDKENHSSKEDAVFSTERLFELMYLKL